MSMTETEFDSHAEAWLAEDCAGLATRQSPYLCACWHSAGWQCGDGDRHHPAKAPDCAIGSHLSHKWRADGDGGSQCEICGLARSTGRQ